MEPKKCAKCSGELVALNGVNKLFLNRYIISDAHLRVCRQCGEEYISDREYARILQKINAVESKVQIPSVGEIFAKAKFFVL